MTRSPFGPAADHPEVGGQDRLVAAVDLIGRTGARELQVGHDADDPALPMEQQPRPVRWWAGARWRGTRISEEGHPTPVEAAEALALKLLNGGRCSCGKVASSDPAGIMAHDQTMADGSKWTTRQQAEAGVCTWRRVGPKWLPGCGQQGPRTSEVSWR